MDRTLRCGTPDEVGMSPERIERIRRLGARWVEEGISPALQVVVARRGVVVLDEVWGVMGPEADAPPLTSRRDLRAGLDDQADHGHRRHVPGRGRAARAEPADPGVRPGVCRRGQGGGNGPSPPDPHVRPQGRRPGRLRPGRGSGPDGSHSRQRYRASRDDMFLAAALLRRHPRRATLGRARAPRCRTATTATDCSARS